MGGLLSVGDMTSRFFFLFLTKVYYYYYYYYHFCFLGPHSWHMEVPRLGVKSELQGLASDTATATPDLSRICNLNHSSEQHHILNPLSEARDRTYVLMYTSQDCYC